MDLLFIITIHVYRKINYPKKYGKLYSNKGHIGK